MIEIPEDGWGLDAKDAPLGLLDGRSGLAQPFRSEEHTSELQSQVYITRMPSSA